jgi:hypothetical protein
MYRHGATCLTGPVSAARDWWFATPPETESADDRLPVFVTQAAAAPQGEIRQDLVARVRREIAAGTYETADKLETALARLFLHLDC